jgi:hypothetical protein
MASAQDLILAVGQSNQTSNLTIIHNITITTIDSKQSLINIQNPSFTSQIPKN